MRLETLERPVRRASGAVNAYRIDLAQFQGTIGPADGTDMVWLSIAVVLNRAFRTSQVSANIQWNTLTSLLDELLDSVKYGSMTDPIDALGESAERVWLRQVHALEQFEFGILQTLPAHVVRDLPSDWIVRIRNASKVRGHEGRAAAVGDAIAAMVAIMRRERLPHLAAFVLDWSLTATAMQELTAPHMARLHFQNGSVALWLNELDAAGEQLSCALEVAEECGDRGVVLASRRGIRLIDRLQKLFDRSEGDLVRSYEILLLLDDRLAQRP
jgi:hypothetical protein